MILLPCHKVASKDFSTLNFAFFPYTESGYATFLVYTSMELHIFLISGRFENQLALAFRLKYRGRVRVRVRVSERCMMCVENLISGQYRVSYKQEYIFLYFHAGDQHELMLPYVSCRVSCKGPLIFSHYAAVITQLNVILKFLAQYTLV